MPIFKPKIRTRFAPSPTGFLHVGGLRTALYAYLFTKQNKGDFILRIEDTDQTREVGGATQKLLESLKWTGLEPDEGVITDKQGKIAEKGNLGPYIQSKRTKLYQKYAKKLVEDNNAYYCFCSPERLENLRRQQQAEKKPTHYDWHCRHLTKQEIEEKLEKKVKYVVRMKVPENQELTFVDWVRGEVKIRTADIDDQVILKSDGFPTYHLANVIDDHLMKISHVIRGEEWLPSTPKHILLYMFLKWETPQFIHLPLLLNSDKSKLSKRQGDIAIEDYWAQGYLPEALINFIALLGWNPGTDQEIFSLAELIKKFNLTKIHKAGAVFNQKKLDWMNSEYIKKIDDKQFTELTRPILEKKFQNLPNNLEKILKLEKERINRLNEVGDNVKFFFTDDLKYDPQLLIWKKTDQEITIKNLEILINELKKYQIGDWTSAKLEKNILKFIKQNNLNNGDVLWPMRVALTGEQKSPPPFEIAEILGQEKSLARLNIALNFLN